MKVVTRLFSLTKAELAAKANELNFVRDTLEKVLRLADILDYLNTNLLTKDTLALKGGTAINLTVFNLLRLSVLPIEIFAGKINALLSRAAARDLYDNYIMIRYGLFRKSEFDLLRKSVVFYTAISQQEIPQIYDMNRIDAITIHKIKTDLLPVIHKGEFVELENMKNTVKGFIEKLLLLTDDEKAFLKAFSEKQYKPELLFDDSDILNRIRRHPMVLWKMQDRK
jgi:predicted nucleotidyltransferase component of viral defense system